MWGGEAAFEPQRQVRVEPRPWHAVSGGGRLASLHSSCSWEELRLGVGETPSPVGSRIWAGSRARRPERTGHSNLSRRPSPRRDVTAREAGVGAAPEYSRPPAPHPNSRLAPFAHRRHGLVCPKANSGRRQGCRFETLLLLLALRAISSSNTLGLSLRSLLRFSDLSRPGPARAFASNRRRA